jgi:hypothetical protein
MLPAAVYVQSRLFASYYVIRATAQPLLQYPILQRRKNTTLRKKDRQNTNAQKS